MLKKGQFDVARKTIYWTIAGIIIAVVLLAFAITIANYKNNLTHVSPKLKASLIAMRFTNIPECFAYQDPETDRVYPGIIDLSKFTNEQMEQSCYHTQSANEINFKLKLQNKGLEIQTNNYFNHPASDVSIRENNLVDIVLVPMVIPMEVLVKDGEEISGDVIEVEVQTGI